MKGLWVFDCEGDSLTPEKFHCLSASKGNGSAVVTTPSYEKMKSFLLSAKILVGHNIARWDLPNLERVLGIKIKAKVVDTLALSWYLYPDRLRHGLEWWGEDFGVPKPPIDDWENLTLLEYMHRCEEDVKINSLLWQKQWKYLLKLYGSEEEAWKLIDYLEFKMDCAKEQERSRWKLDVDKCKANLAKMLDEYKIKHDNLAAAMPQVPKKVKKKRPAKPFKKDGTYSVTGAKWFALLREHNLPEDHRGELEVVHHFEDPNPSSHPQIKAWLYSLGWVPITFDHKREDDGSYRKVEQVRAEVDGVKELCTSVLKLKDKEPAIEYLDGITILEHRIGILKGFLSNVDEEGYVKAEIQGLTNTLRFKHRVCVNLPGVSKPYGDVIRGVLTAPEGYELCGSDQASLEDRTKQHYMWDYDPEYVKEMNTEGFDPHLDIAVLAKMMTAEEVEAFKGGDKSFKPIRHDAKQVNYSCTYGVTPGGIVRNTGMKLGRATTLHETFWKRNWAINAIADNLIVKTVNKQKWLYNPVSKLWYSLRHEKDRFSTLNQGTGTYCFDMWVKKIREKRPQLTAQFHDEVVLCIKKGFRDRATKLLKWAVKEVNKDLNLNRELDVDVQFGSCYADIH